MKATGIFDWRRDRNCREALLVSLCVHFTVRLAAVPRWILGKRVSISTTVLLSGFHFCCIASPPFSTEKLLCAASGIKS